MVIGKTNGDLNDKFKSDKHYLAQQDNFSKVNASDYLGKKL